MQDDMKNFELTLAQQLRVTDYEIVERKRLLNISVQMTKKCSVNAAI